MVGKRPDPVLQTGSGPCDLSHEIDFVVDRQRLQRHRRRHWMPGIGEAVAQRPAGMRAFRDAPIDPFVHLDRGDGQVSRG